MEKHFHNTAQKMIQKMGAMTTGDSDSQLLMAEKLSNMVSFIKTYDDVNSRIDRSFYIITSVIIFGVASALIAITFLGGNKEVTLGIFLAYIALLLALIYLKITERINMKRLTRTLSSMTAQVLYSAAIDDVQLLDKIKKNNSEINQLKEEIQALKSQTKS